MVLHAEAYANERSPLKVHDGVDVMAMFPSAFTLTCLLLFGLPTYLLIENALFPAVRYWNDYSCLLLLFIPIIIGVAHVVHHIRRVPNKFAIIAGLLFPSVLLLLASNGQMTTAMDRADKLFSIDCDTFEGKRELQRSWEAAERLFEDCLNSTVERNPQLSIPQLKEHFRIQDCEEYEAQKNSPTNRRQWDYLRYLEVEHGCTGWCTPGQQLWSRVPHKDSCSTAISAVYAFKIEDHSKQVCIIMISTLVSSAVGLVLLGPLLRQRGYDF